MRLYGWALTEYDLKRRLRHGRVKRRSCEDSEMMDIQEKPTNIRLQAYRSVREYISVVYISKSVAFMTVQETNTTS